MSVCVCVSVYTIAQEIIGEITLNFVVVYGKSLDEFDIMHCQIKLKVTSRL